MAYSLQSKIVLVLYNGLSEIEASLETYESISNTCLSCYRTEYIIIDKRLDNDELKKILMSHLDENERFIFPENVIAFIAMYGDYAEDGSLALQLTKLNVCYTGSEPDTSMLTYDKLMFKTWCTAKGIHTPKHIVYTRNAGSDTTDIHETYMSYNDECFIEWPKLPWEKEKYVIIKPARQGDSTGVKCVEWGDVNALKESLLNALDEDRSSNKCKLALVEQYIHGRELTIGMLAGIALPTVIEIIKEEKQIFSYNSNFCMKLHTDESAIKYRTLGNEIFKAIGGSDYGRLDVIEKDNDIYVLEFNTRPGIRAVVENTKIKKNSLFVTQYKGTYKNLCEIILELSLSRTLWKKFRKNVNSLKAWDMFIYTEKLLEQLNTFGIKNTAALLDDQDTRSKLKLLDDSRTMQRILKSWNIMQSRQYAKDIWEKLWGLYMSVINDVDKNTVFLWVKETTNCQDIDKSSITTLISSVLSSDPIFAKNFLRELSSINIFEVYYERKIDLHILRKTMEWDDTICKCIQLAYTHWYHRNAEISNIICDSITANTETSNRTIEIVYFQGAGLPEVPPKVSKYEVAYTEYIEHKVKLQPYDNFDTLYKTFLNLVQENFGTDVIGYPTRGTLSSFQSLYNKTDANTKFIICTPCEYGPMINLIAADERELLSIDNIDFTVDYIVKQVEDMHTKYTNVPLVMVISSCPRIGGRYLKLDRLYETIRKLDKRNGFSRQLWVDASQDHRIIKTADIVWYSKRFAGTGGGMVVVKRSMNKSIFKSLEIKSGYDPRYIIRICKNLTSSITGIHFCVEDMLSNKYIWKNTVSTVLQSVNKLREYMNEHNINNFFSMCYNEDELKSSQPSPGAIIRLVPKNAFSENYSSRGLEIHLRKRSIGCETFSLSKYYHPSSSIKQAIDDYEGCKRFANILKDNIDMIVWYPKELQEVNEENVCVFKNSAELTIKYHDYIRLFLTSYTSNKNIQSLAEGIGLYIFEGHIVIERYSVNDECQKIFVESILSAYEGKKHGIQDIKAYATKEYNKTINRISLLTYKLTNASNMVAGFAYIENLGQGCCYIQQIAVKYIFQRVGIGSKLMHYMQNLYSTIYLHTKKINVEAKKFYSKHFFVKSSDESHIINHNLMDKNNYDFYTWEKKSCKNNKFPG